MPSFKHKTNKKIILDEKTIITIDSKHKEIEEEFRVNNTNTLPELRSKKKALTKLLETPDLPIVDQLELKDTILSVKNEIKAIKQKEKNYYLNNSKHVFDYFENKKDVSMDNNKTKLLNSFFKIESSDNYDTNNNVNKEVDDDNSSNYQNYLTNLDDSFIDINNFVFQTDICKYCNKGELIPVENEGIILCNKCHKHIPYLVENEKSSYKEPPKEACFYAYKRINHFREILAQFQEKETTQIPEEVVESIKNQIKKERITLEQLSNKKAKDILKKLGYNKYYEHIPFIKDKLGIKPPVMTQDLEELLCNLFIEIQGPYARYCPEDRVNFLNYYYTVYKLCKKKKKNEFLPYFPMLKDRAKRIEQDEVWKKICHDLDWEFIPTI